jgi:type II secretory pathway component GspD/PulD (secretin)
MKVTYFITIAAVCITTGSLNAQNNGKSLVKPVVTQEVAPPPKGPSLPIPVSPAVSNNSSAHQKQEIQKSDEGYIIKDAALNDIFQFLAQSAGRQYFHNAKINGPDFLVTGHLNNGNPLQQMEELAFMYGLSLHVKGSTIYALTQAQLSQLPSSEFHYQLRYLRPTDIAQIKELLKPMLTPGTGIVNFEPKTNTIIIIDTTNRIEQVRKLLHGIDKAKGQIIVETKILRVNSTAAEHTGVNWSASLGSAGTVISLSQNLNSVFGLPTPPGQLVGGYANTDLVLSPIQLNGVLRALNEGNLASQVSNPTLITEDNEQATISIIDRIPIITTTTTQASTGGNPTVTEEVRYKIDKSDKSIDTDPDKHREIGISLVVTPTLLPDGTIRMKLRPRSAQIVAEVKSISGNVYPQVTESMVETLARVPDGYSLVVGGFYGETKSDDKTKIPLLGDIPILNFFFKSKEASKEKTSLVFVVTPKSYDPTNPKANSGASTRLRRATIFDAQSDWVDDDNPGPAHEPNLHRTLRGMKPSQAPYYPTKEELNSEPDQVSPLGKAPRPAFTRASGG